MSKHRVAVAFLLVLCLSVAASLRAQQEHPKQEHPKKQEHPASKPATTADLEKAIRAHVDEMAKKNDGRFPVKDGELQKTWALSLDRVHTDKLTQLKDDTYFACVDFKADDGTAVDVDFYLQSKEGKLTITDTTVHKVNGQARYYYQQKGDRWERVKTEG